MLTVAEAVHRLQTEASSLAEDAEDNSCWVVTAPTSPFFISAASAGWHRLWGYREKESYGKTTSIINGPGHDARACSALTDKYMTDGVASARCRNTARDGAVYSHAIELTRLADGCLAVSRDVILVRNAGAHAEWTRLRMQLEDRGVSEVQRGGAAAAHSRMARHEAAWKLLCNHDRVTADITNPSPASQPELERVSSKLEAIVDTFLLELTRRLLGNKAARDATKAKAHREVWAAAARFLSLRIQTTGSRVGGRPNDLSAAGAMAMRAVLDEMGAEAAEHQAPAAMPARKRPRSQGEVSTLGWERVPGTHSQLEGALLHALRQMDATFERRASAIIVRARCDVPFGIPLAPLVHDTPDDVVQPPMNLKVEALLDELLSVLPNWLVLSIVVDESHDVDPSKIPTSDIRVRRLDGSPLLLQGFCSELSHKIRMQRSVAYWTPERRSV